MQLTGQIPQWKPRITGRKYGETGELQLVTKYVDGWVDIVAIPSVPLFN